MPNRWTRDTCEASVNESGTKAGYIIKCLKADLTNHQCLESLLSAKHVICTNLYAQVPMPREPRVSQEAS